MKTTLTKDDPKGWYECEIVGDPVEKRALCWDGSNMRLGRTAVSWPYTNFCRLHTEADVEEKEQYLQDLEIHRQNLLRDNHRLIDKLERLKAQPYPMRKAEKPDCVGLWRKDKLVRYYEVTNVEQGFPDGPWHYVGPIPVIPVEQQPPQVVKVREKETGVTADAIVGNIKGLYTLLSLDGKACSVVSGDNWEVSQ